MRIPQLASGTSLPKEVKAFLSSLGEGIAPTENLQLHKLPDRDLSEISLPDYDVFLNGSGRRILGFIDKRLYSRVQKPTQWAEPAADKPFYRSAKDIRGAASNTVYSLKWRTAEKCEVGPLPKLNANGLVMRSIVWVQWSQVKSGRKRIFCKVGLDDLSGQVVELQRSADDRGSMTLPELPHDFPLKEDDRHPESALNYKIAHLSPESQPLLLDVPLKIFCFAVLASGGLFWARSWWKERHYHRGGQAP